jgi:hypothetical protein
MLESPFCLFLWGWFFGRVFCAPASPGGFALVLRGCIAGFSWNTISKFQNKNKNAGKYFERVNHPLPFSLCQNFLFPKCCGKPGFFRKPVAQNWEKIGLRVVYHV